MRESIFNSHFCTYSMLNDLIRNVQVNVKQFNHTEQNYLKLDMHDMFCCTSSYCRSYSHEGRGKSVWFYVNSRLKTASSDYFPRNRLHMVSYVSFEHY